MEIQTQEAFDEYMRCKECGSKMSFYLVNEETDVKFNFESNVITVPVMCDQHLSERSFTQKNFLRLHEAGIIGFKVYREINRKYLAAKERYFKEPKTARKEEGKGREREAKVEGSERPRAVLRTDAECEAGASKVLDELRRLQNRVEALEKRSYPTNSSTGIIILLVIWQLTSYLVFIDINWFYIPHVVFWVGILCLIISNVEGKRR